MGGDRYDHLTARSLVQCQHEDERPSADTFRRLVSCGSERHRHRCLPTRRCHHGDGASVAGLVLCRVCSHRDSYDALSLRRNHGGVGAAAAGDCAECAVDDSDVVGIESDHAFSESEGDGKDPGDLGRQSSNADGRGGGIDHDAGVHSERIGLVVGGVCDNSQVEVGVVVVDSGFDGVGCRPALAAACDGGCPARDGRRRRSAQIFAGLEGDGDGVAFFPIAGVSVGGEGRRGDGRRGVVNVGDVDRYRCDGVLSSAAGAAGGGDGESVAGLGGFEVFAEADVGDLA